MADSLQYAVSLTPIESLVSGEDASTHNILSPVTAKSLGGGTSIDLTGSIDASIGYASGVPAYLSVTSGGVALDSDTTEARGIFIKNTGYTYSSPTVLGAAITKTFTITVGLKLIAGLGAGDSIFLPNAGGGANNLKPSEFTLTAIDATNIACEFLVITL